jgi:hypothetical protein
MLETMRCVKENLRTMYCYWLNNLTTPLFSAVEIYVEMYFMASYKVISSLDYQFRKILCITN